MGHDEPTLLAFLEGTLTATEAEGFDAHLLGCESCWTAVREDRAGRDALRSLLELAPPRRGDLSLACLSRPRHMLLVGDLPAERLVEFGHQLAAR
jgi:anti-sigma factor RsiW